MAHRRSAKLSIGKKSIDLPIMKGTDGNISLDIRHLRAETGVTCFDPGYVNTAHCRSGITFLDGEEGILQHRGYSIDELVKHCSFTQVAYLLVHGELPNPEASTHFSELLNANSMIHEDMRTFFRNYPEHAHPMAVLSAMVVSLSTFYPELAEPGPEEMDLTVTRLLSKLRTLAAFSYKKSVGEPFVYPRHDLSYCENFLNMMFSSPVKEFNIDPVMTKALNQLLILHADHEQNCSTSAVRLVGSSMAGLYASVTGGICALWGPRHGGANQAVIEMLDRIQRRDDGNVERVIERVKNKNSHFRLMGFGHRVYKTYDPRAKIAKEMCHEVLQRTGKKDKLLDLAVRLEERALADPFFIERNLYPNVDFYTGLIFRAMGIPTNMFTVMFALGRLPGWIANWLELRKEPGMRIGRPRQIYTGPDPRKFREITSDQKMMAAAAWAARER